MEYVLLVILLIAAVAIVATVLFQKSDEGGLSSAIAGGSETYYGKDKSTHTNRRLFKITLVAAIVFAIAVLAVYVMQIDYDDARPYVDDWSQNISEHSDVFGEEHDH